MPNPPAGGPPLAGRPRLFIQYIRNYSPYLEAISSIHSLRMRHAVVTRDMLNVVLRNMNLINKLYGQNSELCNAKAGDVYSSHCALKG
jgi:hypothetical protein